MLSYAFEPPLYMSLSTVAQLANQWASPSDVSTVLMIIGGDVVRAALAQSTGASFTPVCFSFGWVSYAFMALIGVIGDGRLLPPADYPVKVFNLGSGYVRDNKNWVLGRIVRDHEASIGKKHICDEGIRISVFEAQFNRNCWTRFSFDWTHLFGLIGMLVQLAIAAIPAVLSGDWAILLITSVGTALALAHGALPQWTAEKLPNRQHADITFGLTTGNGSKDIMIIIGAGRCLNLEEFAVTDTPRNGRPWEKFAKTPYTTARDDYPDGHFFQRTSSFPRQAVVVCGFPVGFWITLVTTVTQTILWLALLVTVASVKSNTWYLLLVGGIGMFQNGIIAAIERPPEARNMPLKPSKDGVIIRRKVMDALMDLEDGFKCARPLLKEFFPGDLRDDEVDWWQGNRDAYERKRKQQQHIRGIPPGSKIPQDSTVVPGNTRSSEIAHQKGSNSMPSTFTSPRFSQTPAARKPDQKLMRHPTTIQEEDESGQDNPLKSASQVHIATGEVGMAKGDHIGPHLTDSRMSPSWR